MIQPPVGGAFGGKDDLIYQTSAQVARLALLTGRPVRMIFTREESMIASYKRDAMQMHIRLGADRAGTLRASKVRRRGGQRRLRRHHAVHRLAWQHPRHGALPLRGLSRGHRRGLHQQRLFRRVPRLRQHRDVPPASSRRSTSWPTSWAWIRSTSACATACAPATRPRTASGWATMWRWPNAWSRCAAIRIGIASGKHTMACCRGRQARSANCAAASASLPSSTACRWAPKAPTSPSCTIAVNDDYSLTLSAGLTDYGTGSRTVFTLIAAEVAGPASRAHPHAAARHRHGRQQRSDGGLARHRAGRQCGACRSRAARQPADAGRRRSAGLRARPGAARRRALHRPSEEPVSFEQVVDHARRSGLAAFGARALERARESLVVRERAAASPTSPITSARRWPKCWWTPAPARWR